MTSMLPPICLGCARFRKQDGNKFTCDAYPGGIPQEIISSQVDHREVFEGDHGLQFLPVDDDAARYAATIFEPSRG